MEEAQEGLSKAVSILGKNQTNQGLGLVEPLQTRAELFVQLKQWEAAQADLEKVLGIIQNRYTGFGLPTADALRALGDFYFQKGDKDKAKNYYGQALKTYQGFLMGNKGYPALDIMEKAAAADRGSEKYSEALDLDSQAFEVEKEVYGPEHPRTALCEARMAWDEEYLGKGDLARTHRQEAKTILQAALGSSHPLALLIDQPPLSLSKP